MKSIFGCFAVSFCLLISDPGYAGQSPIAIGCMMPEITLAAPESPAYKKYLGITEKETFTIPQIKTEILIIEIFSMYCPHCQREAPAINQLYNKAEEDPILRDKVRFIGIGAGNSEFEVGIFQKKYKIPFPLFPDPDLSIHKKIGEVRTPYFIGVKINKDGTGKIFFSELGGIKDNSLFLNMIRKHLTSK